ncbi:MAG: NAD(P)H-binding protein [Gammaproteobacteria bacterium]
MTNEITLVLGGTGKTGRRIVERLEQRGVPTRAAARSTGFDWHDPTSWDAVLDNVKAAYINYAPDLAVPGATEAIRLFAQKAVEAGVQRLVLLSGRGEDEAQRCEKIVQDAGVDWTIVRASWFQQNFSEGEFVELVLAGAVTLPAGDVQEPFIDIDDIADVAVAALTEAGHTGEVYEVTGPRLMTFAEAVQEIAHASGRDVAYVQIPHDAFVAGIAASGAPSEMAWLLDYLFTSVLDGRNAYLTDGVQRALGREPTDFAEYARRTAATGVWDAAPRQMAAG